MSVPAIRSAFSRSWSRCAFDRRMLECMGTPLTPTTVRRRKHLELEAVVPSKNVSFPKLTSSKLVVTGSGSFQKQRSIGCGARHSSPDASSSESSSSAAKSSLSDFLCPTRGESSNGAEKFKKTSNSSPTSPRLKTRPRSATVSFRTNGKCTSSAGSSPASLRSALSRVSTEDDMSIKLDKATYRDMFQDIVSIKSMLHKLNHILTETDGVTLPYPEDDPSMDLKKQVAFLQQQLQQRESTLQALRNQVNQTIDHRSHNEQRPSCNAATQTDRVRPTSTGPSLLQNLPSDSNLVSNGSSRKVSESSDESPRISLIRTAPANRNGGEHNGKHVMRTAPADKILEKVKELSFKPVEALECDNMERRSKKNVFKITKIDLVLKSDNYGQTELRLS